ncbi:hypothetical protein PH5382_02781 [Phaeobacter sp. CECT 5382]|nr:hypothetical protein PH5382_02781 [Phaeobacter sp. CECT 5382]
MRLRRAGSMPRARREGQVRPAALHETFPKSPEKAPLFTAWPYALPNLNKILIITCCIEWATSR